MPPASLLLPQGLGERETEFEGHGETLEPLGQGREMADGGDHFGDPVVDVGVAGAAPYLEERDLAVVEDDELDDRHAAPVAQHGLRQHIVVLPDQRMHISEVLVAGCRGAGEPPAAGRQIPRLFDPARHLMSRRRRLWRGFGNEVGLRRIGFRRRDGRWRQRRGLLRLLGRLRLGGWSFGLGRFFGRRRVALRLIDLFGFRFAEILRCEAAARRRRSGFWLRYRRGRRRLWRRLDHELDGYRLGLGGWRNRPIDQQQQRQQVQYQRANWPAQPAPPARSFD